MSRLNLVKNNEDLSKIKKLRLIFPGEGEEPGVDLLQKMGLVTVFFTSLSQLYEYIDKLVENNVKVDELVIGSHGSGGNLLITQRDGEINFDYTFLTKLKPLIKSHETHVLFTACYGAEELSSLKNAGEVLGTRVYGITGLSIPGLNKVINLFSNKIYSCTSQEIEKTNEEVTNEFLLTNPDYLNPYCKPERTHPIKWLRTKR